jgi:hypothetical protein
MKTLNTGVVCTENKKENGVIAILVNEKQEESYVTKTLTNLFKNLYN